MAGTDDSGRNWLTAAEARALLLPLYEKPQAAEEAIIDLAGAGLLASWCKRWIMQPNDGAEPITSDDYLMPLGFWQQFDSAGRRAVEDWTIGNFSVSYPEEITDILARAFRVMFSEDDLRTVPGVAGTAKAVIPQPEPAQEPDAVSVTAMRAFPQLEKHAAQGADKPVPAAKLKAWFDAWKSLYPQELQNNDTGLEHARLTFPKNKVARERIRAIRDARTPGPKRSAELGDGSAE